MESQTLTNSSPSEQPETAASTGARVVAVQANLVTIEAAEGTQRPLTKNEVICIVPRRETAQYQERLKAEVLRVRGREADAQVFESTRGVGVGDRAEQTGELLSVTLGPGLLGRVYDGLQNSLPDLSAGYGNFLPRGVIAPALDLKKKMVLHTESSRRRSSQSRRYDRDSAGRPVHAQDHGSFRYNRRGRSDLDPSGKFHRRLAGSASP